jgi:O-antigen ligase
VLGGAAVAAALAFVALTGFEAGFGRLLASRGSELASAGARVEALAATAELAARFPATGVGLGAFRAGFPLVHAAGEGTWWHAHGDWLELAATAGALGVALVGLGLVALGRGLARAWREGERSEDRAAALAAIGALVAVGLQELVEFGMTLPANALTLAALCGAACAVRLRPEEPVGVVEGVEGE